MRCSSNCLTVPVQEVDYKEMKKQEDDAVLFTKHKADPFVLRVQCNTKVLSTCIFPASARSGNVTLTELPGLWSERVPGALRPCPGVVRGFQQ